MGPHSCSRLLCCSSFRRPDPYYPNPYSKFETGSLGSLLNRIQESLGIDVAGIHGQGGASLFRGQR